MQPDELRALRRALGWTAKHLAAHLGVGVDLVRAWEAGTAFPTRKSVVILRELAATPALAGPESPGKTVTLTGSGPTPERGPSALADPRLWRVVELLVEHPDRLDEVVALLERATTAR